MATYEVVKNGKSTHNEDFIGIRQRMAQADHPTDATESTSIHCHHEDTSKSAQSFIILAAVFAVAVMLLYGIYLNFPKLEESERQYFILPRDIENAKNLGKVLSKYKDAHYYEVLGAYFTTYIFLQTFAIPGSIFLSILSGFLFPFPLALLLVCLSSSCGASFCYLLFDLVGKPIVWKYCPDRAESWAKRVNQHREHLLNYIIFLRITPFLPNWFINITSPIIRVPLMPFFWGTFIGVAPPSFIAIRGGTMLYQLTSSGDALSWASVVVLAVLAILSIIPVVFKQWLGRKFA